MFAIDYDVCAAQGTCQTCGEGIECDLPIHDPETDCILDGCRCLLNRSEGQ